MDKLESEKILKTIVLGWQGEVAHIHGLYLHEPQELHPVLMVKFFVCFILFNIFIGL